MNKKFNIVITAIIIQLLFATLMTTFAANFPTNNTLTQLNANTTSVNKQIASAQQLQSKFSGNNSVISFVNSVTLIYTSANLIQSFISNFFFAFPNMATMLMKTVFYFFPVGAVLQATILTFVWAIVFILYTIMIVMFIISLWSNPSSLI